MSVLMDASSGMMTDYICNFLKHISPVVYSLLLIFNGMNMTFSVISWSHGVTDNHIWNFY